MTDTTPDAVEYVVLLPGDESAWERMSAEDQEKTFDRHREFSELLTERGHEITGGAQIEHSRAAKVVRGARGATDGPYAETTEQLSGFYLVTSSDLDDLLDICGVLAANGEAIEVRRLFTEEPTG